MLRPASITVHVPRPLRECCGGATEISLPGPTVRALLNEMERAYPALHRSVCDETGAVRRHINVFVNTSYMGEREGLETLLSTGDEVTIFPAVSGG